MTMMINIIYSYGSTTGVTSDQITFVRPLHPEYPRLSITANILIIIIIIMIVIMIIIVVIIMIVACGQEDNGASN